MPMPWSVTTISIQVAVDVRAATCTRPGVAVLHGVLERLPTADTSWRRLPTTDAVGRLGISMLTVTARCSAAGRDTLDGARRTTSTTRRRRARLPRRARCATAPAGRRSCAPHDVPRRPSSRRAVATTPRSSSSTNVSASTASAPTGVFSSWLMLATKSVRTASSGRRSLDVLDRGDSAAAVERRAAATMTTTRAGGPIELDGLARWSRRQRGARERVDGVVDEHVACACAVEAPGRACCGTTHACPSAVADTTPSGRGASSASLAAVSSLEVLPSGQPRRRAVLSRRLDPQSPDSDGAADPTDEPGHSSSRSGTAIRRRSSRCSSLPGVASVRRRRARASSR